MGVAWSERLRSIAGPVVGEIADPVRWVREFADDRGHRRRVDVPFLSRLAGVRAGPVPAGAMTPDLALWWGLHGDGFDARGEVAPAGGPLVPQAGLALETWTECELAALHALSWHARGGSAFAAERCEHAVAWLLEHLQPDNATNHPWAMHVFLDRAERAGDAEARMYAETLLHNAIVSGGRPDRFSACILLDAAAWLDGA